MITPNVARLAGAFMLLAQGAATMVLGAASAPPSARIGAVVVFFSSGTAPLARSETAVPGAVAATVAALVWTVYAAARGGLGTVVYELPALALLGAALLVHSARSEVE